MSNLERHLPKDLAPAVLKAAEISYEEHKDKLTELDLKKLYLLAFYYGYETAASIYTDDDEEVLKAYDK